MYFMFCSRGNRMKLKKKSTWKVFSTHSTTPRPMSSKNFHDCRTLCVVNDTNVYHLEERLKNSKLKSRE